MVLKHVSTMMLKIVTVLLLLIGNTIAYLSKRYIDTELVGDLNTEYLWEIQKYSSNHHHYIVARPYLFSADGTRFEYVQPYMNSQEKCIGCIHRFELLFWSIEDHSKLRIKLRLYLDISKAVQAGDEPRGSKYGTPGARSPLELHEIARRTNTGKFADKAVYNILFKNCQTYAKELKQALIKDLHLTKPPPHPVG